MSASRAGFITAPGLYLYGLAGAAFVNHDLNVNFATAARSNVTTPGFTLVLAANTIRRRGRSPAIQSRVFAAISAYVWNDANFNTPHRRRPSTTLSGVRTTR